MEYGLSMLIYLVAYFILLALFSTGSAIAVIGFVMLIPMLWFLWAQGAKRCHDIGRSGWFQLIPFFGLVMLFSNGHSGRNEYGPNPKEDPDAQPYSELESETLDGHLRNDNNN